MSEIFLSLGSNIIVRETWIKKAISKISEFCSIDTISSFYYTAPEGFSNQPLFCNVVCHGLSVFNPFQLLLKVKEVENSIGFTRQFLNGPRAIDIDLLFYDSLQLSVPGLTIPHPKLNNRIFVLGPLAEVAPNFIHPTFNKSILEIYNSFKQSRGNNTLIEKKVY
jgi:2-amino-4-hydroxy-6-hydroxymethyldihydropteridine diphosphokinase